MITKNIDEIWHLKLYKTTFGWSAHVTNGMAHVGEVPWSAWTPERLVAKVAKYAAKTSRTGRIIIQTEIDKRGIA